MQAHDILHFWFEELTPAQHFAQSDALDAQMVKRAQESENSTAAYLGQLEQQIRRS